MDAKTKKGIINDFAKGSGDTGSPAVQVAIFTKRIADLTEHLKSHPNDDHSRRGLIKLVGKRRSQLNYMKYHDKDGFEQVSDKLGLKR